MQPPINNGRRASDGGSNISLFNHFYSLKNNNNTNTLANHDLANNGLINFESDDNNGSKSLYNSFDTYNEIQFNQDVYPKLKQRGSITSGLPIFNMNVNSSAPMANNDHNSPKL